MAEITKKQLKQPLIQESEQYQSIEIPETQQNVQYNQQINLVNFNPQNHAINGGNSQNLSDQAQPSQDSQIEEQVQQEDPNQPEFQNNNNVVLVLKPLLKNSIYHLKCELAFWIAQALIQSFLPILLLKHDSNNYNIDNTNTPEVYITIILFCQSIISLPYNIYILVKLFNRNKMIEIGESMHLVYELNNDEEEQHYQADNTQEWITQLQIKQRLVKEFKLIGFFGVTNFLFIMAVILVFCINISHIFENVGQSINNYFLFCCVIYAYFYALEAVLLVLFIVVGIAVGVTELVQYCFHRQKKKEQFNQLSKKLKAHKYDKQGNEECSICLSEFEKGDMVIKLPCDHEFHQKCLLNWVKISQHCPLCRRDLTPLIHGNDQSQNQYQDQVQIDEYQQYQ